MAQQRNHSFHQRRDANVQFLIVSRHNKPRMSQEKHEVADGPCLVLPSPTFPRFVTTNVSHPRDPEIFTWEHAGKHRTFDANLGAMRGVSAKLVALPERSGDATLFRKTQVFFCHRKLDRSTCEEGLQGRHWALLFRFKGGNQAVYEGIKSAGGRLIPSFRQDLEDGFEWEVEEIAKMQLSPLAVRDAAASMNRDRRIKHAGMGNCQLWVLMLVHGLKIKWDEQPSLVKFRDLLNTRSLPSGRT
ncbi:unnamed protein product [Darwinula stevensoni]|uniref:Uncharacterized protein n=1 Tax=Darwinula stevensoni TaxID=69355 RepID=A0A7R9ACD9_9CRUS|nr:unnamed protein product [Darwinula stevensoni]CAG0899724.1 unnamed protein product [Darwinula stevensoni]